MSPTNYRAQDRSSPRFAQHRAKLAVCVLFLAFAGCSDDPSPTEKCDDLLTNVCSRIVACVGGVTQQECVQELQSAASCGSVTGVNANYDRCMQQLRGFSCSVLFPADPQSGELTFEPPSDCRAVFQGSSDVTGLEEPIEEAIGSLMQSEP
jgi:hypothetical protein